MDQVSIQYDLYYGKHYAIFPISAGACVWSSKTVLSKIEKTEKIMKYYNILDLA